MENEIKKQQTNDKNNQSNRKYSEKLKISEIKKETDILIIGGGNAGIFAAYAAKMKDP